MLFPIAQLLNGRDAPVCVTEDTTVREALTLMIENDFSQLPIVDKTGRLTGVISEKTISRLHYHLGEEADQVSLLSISVNHCRSKPETLSGDRDIFDALEILQRGAASIVIVDEAIRPTGIVTDYDTAHFFRDYSQDLIRVQDVEVKLREYIESAYPEESSMQAALAAAFGVDKSDPTQPAKRYDKLTFNNYLQLITCGTNWGRFESIFGPKTLFLRLMNRVREIRNELAHFRGTPDLVQQSVLNQAIDWLEGRPTITSSLAETRTITAHDAATVQEALPDLRRVAETRESDLDSFRERPDRDRIQIIGGKYAPLHRWLAEQKENGHAIRIGFSDIERLIGNDLPPTAREHRSWWANDSVSRRQSIAWLSAGWRVENVDFTTETVTFRRSDSVRYQPFFTDLLERLKAARPDLTSADKVSPTDWWAFSAGRTGFRYMWSFNSLDRTLRVELYIDLGKRAMNKAAFDTLWNQRETIEAEVDMPLTWQRLDNQRASRITTSIPAAISDPPEKLEEIKNWAIEVMLKFVDVFRDRIKEL